jgi:hypothetical protein
MAEGMNYTDAHTKADKKYSFMKFVRELNEREGIK